MAQDVAGTLACNTGPNGNDAGNFCSNQGVDAGYIVAVNIEHALGDHGGSNAASVKLRDVAEPLTRSEHKGKTLVLDAFAFSSRARDGVKLPEIMRDGLVPALTNSGDGGRSDAINVCVPVQEVGKRTGPSSTGDVRAGIGRDGDPMFTLQAGAQHGVMQSLAFSSKDYGGDASVEVAPTLRSMGHHGSHANGGGQLAVAMVNMQSNAVAQADGPSYTLQAMHGHDVHAVLVAARESGPGFWTQDGVTGPLRAEGENRPSRPSNVVLASAHTASALCEGGHGITELDTATALQAQGGGKPGQGYAAIRRLVAVNIEHALGDHGGSNAASVKCGQADHCMALPPSRAAYFLHANKGRPSGRSSKHTEMVTVEEDIVPTLATRGHQQSAVALCEGAHGITELDAVPTLQAQGGGKPEQGYGAARSAMCVRRITPRECERLQGFPDDYTEIMFRGKLAADGPRYKALGNSMAVPVMRWIGARIIANSER